MPLSIVHLAIANEVNKKLKLKNDSDFLVGNIAPDAIHMRERTTQEDKHITHLNIKDINEEIKMKHDVCAFFSDEIKTEDIRHNTFTLGYCSHLITDYYWFNTIFKMFEKRLPKDIKLKELRSLYYFDTDHIDSKLYHWSEWTQGVMNKISKVQSNSNQFLSEDEINKWTERTINWFSDGRLDPEKETKYLTYEEILEFIRDTSKNVTKIIYHLLDKVELKL